MSLPMFTPMAPLATRILSLSGFPPELKTRDILAVFQEWEDEKGGFKIKWVDDTTALVIFNDPAIAKRAYLHTLMSPPPSLINSEGVAAKVRPYDSDDANEIISSVLNRPRSRSNANTGGASAQPAYGQGRSSSPSSAFAAGAMATGGSPPGGSALDAGNSPGSSSPKRQAAAAPAASTSTTTTTTTTAPSSMRSGSAGMGSLLGHRRHPSGSNPSSLPAKPVAAALFDAAQGGPSPARHLANAAAAERAAALQAQAASAAMEAGKTTTLKSGNGNGTTGGGGGGVSTLPATNGTPLSPLPEAGATSSGGGGSGSGGASPTKGVQSPA